MGKEEAKNNRLGKFGATSAVLSALAIVTIGSLVFLWSSEKPETRVAPTKMGKLEPYQVNLKINPFGVNLATGVVVPSQPTINPANPYDPMPLRIGTVGATAFHRPFCPHAKQSLATHGPEKRINYWTREQVAESKRPGDNFCQASRFDCLKVEPAEFAISGNDPWCGANIRNSRYNVTGIDAAIAGKTLCQMQGRIGLFVDDPTDCVNGAFVGSSPPCDPTTCDECRNPPDGSPSGDCTSACDGCTLITMALMNKITLGMGDANKDGQADLDDYLYYHECYSGPTAATIPCQNVFDFDSDADVDAADFDLFVQAYNTGNESWAAANFSEAVINPPKPELPLRVGTDGSAIYHRIDCPAVNNSWQTWGIDRRVDYFSWDQVEASGRTSDATVCLAGKRNNPSGSLQNCALDDDGDGSLNCEDGCPESAWKIEPGVCGCEKADMDQDGDGTLNCNDECMSDPNKITPGLCGCGVEDPIDGSPCP